MYEEEAEGSVVAAEGYEDYQYGGGEEGEEEYYDTGLASDPQVGHTSCAVQCDSNYLVASLYAL